MSADPIRAIADAVLYEGYVLYPYRPSAIKNRQRWTFGGVFPRSFSMQSGSDPWSLRAECLVEGGTASALNIRLRFLHLIERAVLAPDGEGAWRPVASLDVGERHVAAWEEAVEQEVETVVPSLAALAESPLRIGFDFPPSRAREEVRDGEGVLVGIIERTGHEIRGAVAIRAADLPDGRLRLSLRIENDSILTQDECASRALAQRSAFASTHLILGVRNGAFVSMTDPPQDAEEAARACVNEGLWPVLVGRPGTHDAMLASPIILYDYPQIAPESPGDLFDGAEIDEILTLRILTMTDAEKREAAAADPRVRALIERTEALGEQDLARLHGALRSPRDFPKPTPVSTACGAGEPLAVGARVRLRPKAGGDIMDIVLAGKIAIVEAIERDFEDRTHVAVTIEDDPGRDLGLGRFPGHRFFFSREELEPLEEEGAS